MQRLIHNADFSRELITNMDQGDAPQNSARRFENCKADQAGKMSGIPGYAAFATGISGFTVQWFQELVLNGTQILLLWGVDGSNVQHFYYSTDLGVTWTDLLEVKFLALNGATTSPDKSFVIKDGTDTAATTNDYYRGWGCFVQGDTQFDYVLDYVGATKTVTTKLGVGTFADGTAIVFMRFPIWDHAFLFSSFSSHRNLVPTGHKPVIVQRQEGVAIFTGRNQDSVSQATDPRTFRNLWFGYVETGNLFDDSDLAFTGYHAELKYLEAIRATLAITLGVTGASDDALDAATYGVMLVPLYDGYQEGDVQLSFVADYPLLLDDDQIQAVASGEELNVTLKWDYPWSAAFQTNREGFRRITAFRIYLCKVASVDTTGGYWEPTTPFFLVHEASLVDTTWAGTGANWTYAVVINGRHWNAGQAFELEFNRGHFSKLWVNADMGVEVGGREIAGSLAYGSQVSTTVPKEILENTAYLVPCAVSSVGRATPDALPVGSIVNMGEYRIYQINQMLEIGGQLAVVGANKMQILGFNASGQLVPVDSFYGVGASGKWSGFSNGKELFLANQNSIYLRGRAGEPQEVGYVIRSDWQALSASNRQTSIATYRQKDKSFILHSQSGTTYVYDVQKSTWRTYVTSLDQINWITQGVDGEILATDGSDIYELFAASPTETLVSTYEKDYEFETEVDFKQFWLNYKSTTSIKVYFFDLAFSETYPVLELLFLPQTTESTQKEKATFKAQRIRVRIEKQSSADQAWLVNFYEIWGNPLRGERDND